MKNGLSPLLAAPLTLSLAGTSFNQFMTNPQNVLNNSNFSFRYVFGASALITIISLILLALFDGAMTVFIFTGMVKTVPYDLEEAASIDGCS